MAAQKRTLRTIVWKDDGLLCLDQRFLPHRITFFHARTVEDIVYAIKEMVVRGAPLIGIVGAYGVYIASRTTRSKRDFQRAIERIARARPTAVDLRTMVKRAAAAHTPSAIWDVVQRMNAAQEAACRAIGEYGASLIENGATIHTHCNAGALATVAWGTALAPLYVAKEQGKKLFVYVDETRPRLQGALTSFELQYAGIPHRVICDNARGLLYRRGKIDLCIVGADRVCLRDGSVANKIGTYEVAVIARENDVPFYVAAPLTTCDMEHTESTIPIEERSEEEVLTCHGTRLFPRGVRAWNPAFDVTPAKYITAYITDIGMFTPSQLMRLKKKIRQHFLEKI